jgi:hypothetical protein
LSTIGLTLIEYLTLADPLIFGTTYVGNTMTITSLVISLTVNAIVTGLIVLRILKVYREIGSAVDQTFGVGGDNLKLQSIIFIIVESGMAMFSIQFIRVILSVSLNTINGVQIVIYINQMFNVIIQLVMSTFHVTEVVSRD